MPFKASQMVRMSKSELALAPTLTLKVLVNIRLGQNVPFSSITNLYFLNLSQKYYSNLAILTIWKPLDGTCGKFRK